VPVYHLRMGRFLRVQRHLGANLIFSFLISIHVFLCTKLISNYFCYSTGIELAYGITVTE